jgi:WD40 repeat protein
LAVWDPESGELLHRFEGVAAGSFCNLGQVGNEGKLIAVSDPPSKGTSVHIWNPDENKLVRTFSTGPIGAMARVSDGSGRILLAVMENPYGSSEIKFWDVENGSCYRKLNVGTVRAMATAPSGAGREFLVTVGVNSLVSLYDLWSGQAMGDLVTVAPTQVLLPFSVSGELSPRVLLAGTAGVAAISLGRNG